MRCSVRHQIGGACAVLLVLLYYNLSQVPRTWKPIPWPHHDTSDAATKGPAAQDDPDDTATTRYTSHAAEASSTSTLKVAKASSTATTEVGQPTPTIGSKVIVMAKLEKEDTSWVGDELPDWQNAIYTVDNHNATLHTDINKGRESLVYLTYVVENYEHLPDTIVFLHSIRKGYPAAWHNDAADYDNVISVRELRIDTVQKHGYVNLRCIGNPGCPDEIQPFRDPPEDHRSSEHAFPEAWRYMFQNDDVPRTVGVACCGQFAVSKAQVLSKPKSDYERYLKWLRETPLDDGVSGRVLEYMWHIIYGQRPQFCPDLMTCYCDVYGRC